MKLGFVILNYKTFQKSLELAEYCAINPSSENSVVIVNNDPTDLTGISKCIKIKENLYQINTNNNYGYAKGNNIGAEFLRGKLSCDVIVILNPDVKIENINNLVNLTEVYFQNSNSVCLAYNISGVVPYYHSQNFISILFPFIYRNIFDRIYGKMVNINTNKNENYTNIGRFHGCAFAFRAEKFHEMGLLDEGTFLYGEEIIAALSIKKYGGCVQLANNVNIMHEKKNEATTMLISPHLVNSYSYILFKYFKIPKNASRVMAKFVCYQIHFSTMVMNILEKVYGILRKWR